MPIGYPKNYAKRGLEWTVLTRQSPEAEQGFYL